MQWGSVLEQSAIKKERAQALRFRFANERDQCSRAKRSHNDVDAWQIDVATCKDRDGTLMIARIRIMMD